MFVTLLMDQEGVMVDKNRHITHDPVLSYVISVKCQP